MHHLTVPSPMPVRITRAWSESETLRGLAFAAGALAAHHARPGQYVRVTLGGEESFYALASEPGAREMELLFKPETPLTEAMAALRPGDELEVGLPEGRGFPVGEHEGRDLILCAAGSAIAPLRAVLRSVLPRRSRYGAITLFYGQRDASHFAYAEEHEAWRAAGIEVVLAESGEGDRVPGAVAGAVPATANAVAYLAGMPAMIDAVRETLVGLGLPAARIYLNY